MPASASRSFLPWYVLCLMLVAACSGSEAAERPVQARTLRLEPVATLLDDTAAVLARPGDISIDANGRYVVSDPSDKNIKLYTPDGRRVSTLGGPGRGPGEFLALATALALRDSVLAFDFRGARFSVFSPDARYARSFELPRDVARPWTVQVVDDSLLLLVGTPMRSSRGDLLTLVRRDGSVVSSFFNKSSYFGGKPQLIQNTGVVADARDGRVFAALVGGDSVYAFDYAGKRLGAYPADPEQPLVTTRSLLAANRWSIRRPDGTYVVDRNRNVIRLVALDRSTVAMHVVAYDVKHGVDVLEGGTILTLTVDEAGGATARGRAEMAAGLLGRDRSGNALLVGYAAGNGDEYVVSRLVMYGTDTQPGRQP
jgi:hypothetical protein